MVGLRISIRCLAKWKEPELIACRRGEPSLLPSVKKCLVGTVIVLCFWLAAWHFLAGELLAFLGAGLVWSLFLFVVIRSEGPEVEIWPYSISWSWGLAGGGVVFRDVSFFEWFTQDGFEVFLLLRYNGAAPFEVGVPDDEWREKITQILLQRGIPLKAQCPQCGTWGAMIFEEWAACNVCGQFDLAHLFEDADSQGRGPTASFSDLSPNDVTCERRGSELFIHVPARPLGSAWGSLSFALFWLSSVTTMTLSPFLLSAPSFDRWFIVVFSLPFWAVGIRYFLQVMDTLFVSRTVRLTADELVIELSRFGKVRTTHVERARVRCARPYGWHSERHSVQIILENGMCVLPIKTCEKQRSIIREINKSIMFACAANHAQTKIFEKAVPIDGATLNRTSQ